MAWCQAHLLWTGLPEDWPVVVDEFSLREAIKAMDSPAHGHILANYAHFLYSKAHLWPELRRPVQIALAPGPSAQTHSVRRIVMVRNCSVLP